MLVRRPQELEREVIQTAQLTAAAGMVGDDWLRRGVERSEDDTADTNYQLTLMSSRVVDAVAGSRDRWPLAGDQIYVDMQLSIEVLPIGTRLSVGSAVVEISPEPHTGCKKFVRRFGAGARRFINTGEGKPNRFRGVNAIVVVDGECAVGDQIARI